ncbi:MAG: alpha/beta hydrolase [Opitutaceae bacterium]|nr:alpha/beta hydrolase [Opitutaceae bacterium]
MFSDQSRVMGFSRICGLRSGACLSVPMRFSVLALALCFWGSPFVKADEVRREMDVDYLEAGRKEKLDIYLPADVAVAKVPDNTRPAVVWIHGGGWINGTKSENRAKEFCITLAEAGFVAASIDYRLGKGAWPQNLYDCKNAVRFLRVNATRYGIDPARIAVAGGSAGGHLALMVGLTADQPELEPSVPYPGVSSSVRCVIDMYGITNILTRQKTDTKGRPTGEQNLSSARTVFGVDDANDPIFKLGSPVNHVTPKSPPVLILHGLADTTVDHPQSEELDRILTQKGVPHEMHLLEGVGHTFTLETWRSQPLPQDLRPIVIAFLKKHLSNGSLDGVNP